MVTKQKYEVLLKDMKYDLNKKKYVLKWKISIAYKLI